MLIILMFFLHYLKVNTLKKKPFTGIDQFGNNIVIWNSQVSSSKTRSLGRVEALAFYII